MAGGFDRSDTTTLINHYGKAHRRSRLVLRIEKTQECLFELARSRVPQRTIF